MPSSCAVAIDSKVLAVLSACVVTDNRIEISGGQLERSLYVSVNKILELMGGKWNRAAHAHIFHEHPGDLLDTVILTGQITNKKKLFQFFETPSAIAEQMVDLAEIGRLSNVLEPSAGRGAIAKVINARQPRSLTMFELSPDHFKALASLEIGSAFVGDFLKESCSPMTFEGIVMNPPFSRGQDVAHIKHAVGMLADGGRLVAICADGPRQHGELYHLADKWLPLPAGTFSESGTEVRTVMLRIRN